MKPPGHGAELTRGGWEHAGAVGVAVACAMTWLLALGGLISTISALPVLGWNRALWIAALCAGPPAALWMTRRAVAARRIRAVVPQPMLERRSHGNLEAIADSELRSLRPIAASAYEVAAWTSELLADLLAVPGVRMFHGVRPENSGSPHIPHAICAGRRLVLVESVAWPPGRYETDAHGRIYCDGTYIGQSVSPLTAAVSFWRQKLPKRHHVSAVVVVHLAALARGGTLPPGGRITLPATSAGDVTWVHADDASGAIRQHVARGGKAISRKLMAALIAATSAQI
jgi:hypothetical protein